MLAFGGYFIRTGLFLLYLFNEHLLSSDNVPDIVLTASAVLPIHSLMRLLGSFSPCYTVRKPRHRVLTLPKVTQLASGGAGTFPQAVWLHSLCSYTSSLNKIMYA